VPSPVSFTAPHGILVVVDAAGPSDAPDAGGSPTSGVDPSERDLLRAAWLLTGSWPAAEDLTGTALAYAWPRRQAIGLPASADYTRAVMAAAYLNHRTPRRRRRGEATGAIVGGATGETPRRSPPSGADRVDRAARLLPVLGTLSPQQRIALVFCDFLGLDAEPAAAQLRTTPGEVRSDVAIARRALRALGPADGAAVARLLAEATPEPPTQSGVPVAGAGGFEVPSERRVHFWAAIAATLLLIAVLGAIVLAIRHPGAPEPPPPSASVPASGS